MRLPKRRYEVYLGVELIDGEVHTDYCIIDNGPHDYGKPVLSLRYAWLADLICWGMNTVTPARWGFQ